MPLPGEENLITDADLPLLGVVAEALSDVDGATIIAERGAAIDVVLSALGKRAKRPVTWVDESLRRAMVWKATQYSLINRGFAGIDEATVLAHMEKEIDPWIDLVARGEREPQFIDSTPSTHEMGVLGGSSRLSDERLRAGCFPTRLRKGCGCK